MVGHRSAESPVLRLPDDAEMQARLRLKLDEYQKRLDPYKAPELQQSTYFKFTVLKQLLEQGQVDTYNLSLELGAKFGHRGFDKEAYNNACGVIKDYITTGGANTRRGTGLPTVQT